MSPHLESSPLLSDRNDSYASTDTADCQSKFTLESRIVRLFCRRRFWWFSILGVAAIITLQLSFLPRTSLNRDFRRWHDLHLTRTDVRRIFLVELRVGRPDRDGMTIEQHVDLYLKNLTDINKKRSSGIAASEAPELATYIEREMRLLGFKTKAHTYPLLANVSLPLRLSLHLLDSKLGRKLYTAQLEEPKTLTPSYFTYGKNGTVKGDFIYANAGLPADYTLLEANKISVEGKIVIFSQLLLSEFSLADKIALAESHGCLAVIVQGDLELELSVSRNYKPIVPREDRFRLPVSYNLVQPILKAMGSPTLPFSKWKYLPQCSDNSLQLELTTEFAPQPLNATNIVAQIDGVTHDGEVVVGAARDVLTSLNPSSGHAIMLEVMRRFQNLRRHGWRPLRTIKFVSWDAARSGALGAKASVDDLGMFHKNMPILAYINLDNDPVTGSHLTVDANPLFNHLIKEIATLVPFSRKSTYFKRLLKDNENSEDAQKPNWPEFGTFMMWDVEDEDDGEGDLSSLYHYWHLQNNATINNKLGGVIGAEDTSMFQLNLATPVINLKFEESKTYNDSTFAPESNFYSYKWLNDVDKQLELHGLLVRFLGLFVLSLGEHEVVDSKTEMYFAQVRQFFSDFETSNKKQLATWHETKVEDSLVLKSSLYADFRAALDDEDPQLTVGAVFNLTNTLLEQLVEQASTFDEYNKEVENLLTVDYPWYKMLRKVHIYAKYKVANYKILRLEKDLSLQNGEEDSLKAFHHFMYEIPRGFLGESERIKRGAFGSLYEAIDEKNEKQVVRLIVARYESLRSVFRKMS